jgi:hypothetical protein
MAYPSSLAQTASVETVTDTQPSLPAGFFRKCADKPVYSSQKVLNLTTNPAYFSDMPVQVAEALAYLEFVIDRITRPSNHQFDPKERQRYLEIREKMR